MDIPTWKKQGFPTNTAYLDHLARKKGFESYQDRVKKRIVKTKEKINEVATADEGWDSIYNEWLKLDRGKKEKERIRIKHEFEETREEFANIMVRFAKSNKYDYDISSTEPLCACIDEDAMETIKQSINNQISDFENTISKCAVYDPFKPDPRLCGLFEHPTWGVVVCESVKSAKRDIETLKAFKENLESTPICE